MPLVQQRPASTMQRRRLPGPMPSCQHFVKLLDLYNFVAARPYKADAAAEACRHFCLLYKSLAPEDPASKLWLLKPKFHMLQELFEFQAPELDASPGTFWAYQDEDFVGWVAKFAGSRGGANNADSAALRTLQRYRAWCREL